MSRLDGEPVPFHVVPSANPPPAIVLRSASATSAQHQPRSRERLLPSPSHIVPQNAPPFPNPVTAPEIQGESLHRWSKGTASNTSVASHSHKRSGSFTRRMSFSGGPNSVDTSSPPRKLQKNRPATANSPSSHINVTRTPFDSSLMTLPPINTLPSLQTSVNGSSPLTGPTTPSPSTAQILSAAARSADYFGRAWEDASLGRKDFSQRRSPSASRSNNIGPSPVFGPGSVSESGSIKRQQGEEERPRSRGHSRHRSQTAQGSAGTGSSNRSSKQPSQKAMLSKALQKANTAVLLDNAQNFEGAMQAYSEACSLLQQVMLRSSGDDDKRKLEAIVSSQTRYRATTNTCSVIRTPVEFMN